MKNVTPDSVYSNIKGLQINPNSDKTSNDGDETADEEVQLVTPSTSNSDDSKDKKKMEKV